MYYAIFAILMFSAKVDLNFHVASPWTTLKLNFVTVPTFQIGEQVGSSLGSRLMFAPAPDNAAGIRDYLKDLLQRGLDTHLSSSDHKLKLNFRSLVSLGMYSTNEIFLPATHKDAQGNNCAAQDPTKMDAKALQSLNANFPADELDLILEDAKTDLFKKPATHLYFQVQLRRAVDDVMKDHGIYGHRYKTLQRKVPEPNDMYQGSRAIANMVTCFQEFIDKHSAALDTECNMKIARLSTATCKEFQDLVYSIEDHVSLFKFAGLGDQESSRVSQIVNAAHHHTGHHRSFRIAGAIDTTPKPKTFTDLHQRMLSLPHDDEDSPQIPGAGYFSAVTSFFTGVKPDSSAVQVHTQSYVDRIKHRL